MQRTVAFSSLVAPKTSTVHPGGGNFLGLLIVDAELKQILLIALLPARWKTVKGWK